MEEFANRVTSVGTNRHSLRSNSLQHWIGFFWGTALLIPVMAVSGAAHNSSMKNQSTQFRMQSARMTALIAEDERTITLRNQEVGDLYAQIAQQKTVIGDQENSLTVQAATIAGQGQQISDFKTGLARVRENHPFWRLVIDGVIQFLIDLGCTFLQVLLG